MKSALTILTAITLSMSAAGVARATDKAPPAEKSEAKAPKAKPAPDVKTAGEEVTLKGEMTCAKCGLHEAKKCQNVLRVKEAAAGKETKYYLTKNAVSEEQHSKVCSGSAPATVTGKVADEGGKKVITASAVKFD